MPITFPSLSRRGPPLLHGDAAAEKRIHFHSPDSSSGVSEVYRPSLITTPCPRAFPTAYILSFIRGDSFIWKNCAAFLFLREKTTKSLWSEYFKILSMLYTFPSLSLRKTSLN